MAKQKSKQRITIKGSTGASINEIALQLKAAQPQMKFEDAKQKAKDVLDAQSTIANNGSALRHSILTRVLGKNLGGKTSAAFANKSQQEQAAQILAEHQQTINTPEPTAELMKSIRDIEAKISYLYKEVHDAKTQRVRSTPQSFHAAVAKTQSKATERTMTAHLNRNTQALADAVAALQNLGYNQKEAQAMVRGVPPEITEAPEIIRAALQKADKTKKTGMAQKLPAAEVPAQVAVMRSELPTQATVPPAAIPKTPLTPTQKPQSTPKATQVAPPQTQVPPQVVLQHAETSPPEPQSAPQTMPEPVTRTSETGSKGTTMAVAVTATGTVPQHTETKNDDVAEAAQVKQAQEEIKRAREQKEREERIEHKLDEILKDFSHKNLNQFITGLLGKFIGWFAKQALGIVVKAGKWLMEGAWKLLSKMGGLIKRGGEALWEFIKKGGKALLEGGKKALTAGEEAAAGAASKLGSKVGSVAKVAGKALGVAGAVADVGMGVYDLTQGQRQTEMPSGLDMLSPMKWGMYAGEKINQGVSALTGGEDLSNMISRVGEKDYDPNGDPRLRAVHVLPSTPKSAISAQAVTPNMPESTEQPAPTVINAPVTNKTVVMNGQSNDQVVTIKVRNDESSFAGPAAAMFDHPVTFAGVYSL